MWPHIDVGQETGNKVNILYCTGLACNVSTETVWELVYGLRDRSADYYYS